MIEAGIASEIITPPRGEPLVGYFDPRPNTGAFDDLKVKVTLFRQGDLVTGYVTFDLCYLRMALVKRMRGQIAAFGLTFADNLIFHCTHTHTGPYVSAFFGEETVSPAYLDELVCKTAKAVKRAYANLAPSELSAASTVGNPCSFNRRYYMKDGKVMTNPGKLNPKIVKPEGPVDEEISVLVIRQDGRIASLLINLVNHTDTIGGNFVSADWPGRMEKDLQHILGSDVMAATLIGCSGNINHFDVKSDADQTSYEEAKRIGAIYADIVGKLVAKAKKLKGDKLQCASETVNIPCRVIEKADIKEAEKIMRETENLDEEAEMTSEGLAAGAGPVLRFFAKELLAFAKDWSGVKRDFEFKSLKIGSDFFSVGFPGEPFTQIGLEIKAASKSKFNFIATLAMDEPGYVCMEECYSRGGYEIRPITEAGLDYKAANIYIATGKKLLKRYV